MTITAKIICDSISPQGERLTTFQLRYPRFIHAEELTHRILNSSPESYFTIPDGLMYDRDLSRNASSSRAIPVKRLIEDIRRDPAIPIYWGKNQPGMQAGEDWNENVKISLDVSGRSRITVTREEAWLISMENAILMAMAYDEAGYHKQIVNRLLEPWAHINVVCTATSFANFFALRSHPDAQPEIRMLSDLMQQELRDAEPSELKEDQWHLPYILDSDWVAIRNKITGNGVLRVIPSYEQMVEIARMVSVARCARVSYLTHDGRQTTIDEDLELANKLIIATPLHSSPAEHQATPDWYLSASGESFGWAYPELHGNLIGWQQFRKMLPNEFVPG